MYNYSLPDSEEIFDNEDLTFGPDNSWHWVARWDSNDLTSDDPELRIPIELFAIDGVGNKVVDYRLVEYPICDFRDTHMFPSELLVIERYERGEYLSYIDYLENREAELENAIRFAHAALRAVWGVHQEDYAIE